MKVLIRLPRRIKDPDTGRSVVMNEMEKFYVPDDKDFHFSGGIVKKEDFSKGHFTSGKDSFVCFDPVFLDNYKKIGRGAQIITLKDIGPIIAHTGMNSKSIVMDAGSGSGGLACFLSKIVERIDSFDVEDKNIDVASKNVSFLGLKNVFIQKKDVYIPENFEEGKYDVFTLDVPEPWNALGTASKVLKVGGFLVVYAPNINQIQQAVISLPENFVHEKTMEVIEREWSVKEKVLRPVTKDFGHTAFLSFVRKVCS